MDTFSDFLGSWSYNSVTWLTYTFEKSIAKYTFEKSIAKYTFEKSIAKYTFEKRIYYKYIL